MTSLELRKKFLDFFGKREHAVVPSSSLLPADSSVLFTTAGMQQFKEYFLDKKSPYGNRVASCQKCFRTSDIEEVGDHTHLTFLEMLGNFSFGDPEGEQAPYGAGYFKEEAIKYAFEILTKDFGLPAERLYFTCFKGDKEVPRDRESGRIWQDFGIPPERIYGFGREDNFWGPTGNTGPCGPTTEIHYDLTKSPCKKGKNCIPNCSCGRFVELWNLVFNEYYQDENGALTQLKKKGVDTGMGLERLAMVSQGKFSVFETDLFWPILRQIEKFSPDSYSRNPRPYRVIADHIKGVVFLAAEGIYPSNVEQGYILRRILRKAIMFGRLLQLPPHFLISLAKETVGIYQSVFPEVKSKETDILTVIQNEEEKFEKTLEEGLKHLGKEIVNLQKRGKLRIGLPGKVIFETATTYGIPIELIEEEAKSRGLGIDKKGFEEAFQKHREISRAGVERKFGGVGKGAGLESAKLHTATHLLHSALRKVLGQHVRQMGSDINPQRLRFDFSHPAKMTEEEIKKVEEIVNQKIKEDLEVKKEEMEYGEALKSGALAFFKEKYPERVTVYSVGDFSREVCAGPHVKRTSELGHFKIVKEESAGAGVRRIRAILE